MQPPPLVLGVDVHAPGADSFEAVTRSLRAGHVNARQFPSDRLADASLPTTPDDHYEGGYFERIDEFDHRYFGVPARLAASMDPYQRWCLLSSARALRDAGLLEEVRGTRVGVYASCNQLQQAVYAGLQRRHGVSPDLLAVLGSSVAARVSHALDLRGPAVVVDTACSSSLYALTMACADLLSGVVDTAVVTTANLYLDPGARGTAAVDVVSPTSTTRTFDAAADGVSVGEGVVTLVLRRPEDAAGRTAYGSVESWRVGQDGRTATMASPNPHAQVDLIDRAWRSAGVDPARLELLVSHGTGTAVGDAVELEALSGAAVFGGLARGSVPLISAKANLGHLDAASGLLSVVVALGALSTGVAPPHPSFVAPSTSSDLVDSPFFVPDEPVPVAPGGLAGLSSFGMTGTNVHVVVGAGERVPGPSADLGLDLRRHWFVPEGNTFARASATGTAQTVLGRRTATFAIDARHDWEIAEHRVGGVPLMVGTGVHEVISQLLREASYGLDDHDVVDLTMVGPLSSTDSSIEVVAAVDEESLDGEIVWRTEGSDWKPWVKLKLRPTERIEPLTPGPPSMDGLVDVPVHTAVGDDDAVSVSERWSVVTRLGRSTDGQAAVLDLRVPPTFVGEASRYAFYPPLLDAACNGLNALLVEGEVLLPWVDDRVCYHVPQLRGERFTARIEHRETVRDDRGNVIVRVDADLWDETGACVLSVRGHRVKNRLDDAGGGVAARVLGFDGSPQPRTGGRGPAASGIEDGTSLRSVAVVPLHGRRVDDWAGPGVVVLAPEEVLGDEEHCRAMLHGIDDVVVVGGTVPTGTSVESDCFALGQLLLALHAGSQVRTVTLLEPGSFGPARGEPTDHGGDTTAHLRARAVAGYSLRTELRFDVAVLDAPARPESVEVLRRWVPQGILWLDDRDAETVVRSARFATTHVPRRSTPATPATGRVLLVGASSGIGRAYGEWLTLHHPGLEVVGCGRRVLTDDPPTFRYVVADVTDRGALERLSRELGPVDRIVMFAGEAASGLLVTKARDDFEARMVSKVRGPHLLAAAFDTCPDIVLVGSVSGYVGAMGQTEYAAANAYLTGLADGSHGIRPGATGRADRGTSATGTTGSGTFRCLSLSGWSEIGMSRDLIDDLFVKTTPQEGLPMVHAFVTSTLATGSLFTLSSGASGYSPLLDDVRGLGSGLRPEPVRRATPARAGGATAPARSAAGTTTAVAPALTSVPARGASGAKAIAAQTPSQAQVHSRVLAAWQHVLGDDDYADDVTFFEYGGDSVSVVSLCDELGRAFPDVFDVTTLFSCSTVEDQTRWVQRRLGVSPDVTPRTVDISSIRHLLELNGGSR